MKGRKSLTCPLCRKETPISGDQNLPNNIYVVQMIASKKNSHSSSQYDGLYIFKLDKWNNILLWITVPKFLILPEWIPRRMKTKAKLWWKRRWERERSRQGGLNTLRLPQALPALHRRRRLLLLRVLRPLLVLLRHRPALLLHLPALHLLPRALLHIIHLVLHRR